jgi:hypothetical protein
VAGPGGQALGTSSGGEVLRVVAGALGQAHLATLLPMAGVGRGDLLAAASLAAGAGAEGKAA